MGSGSLPTWVISSRYFCSVGMLLQVENCFSNCQPNGMLHLLLLLYTYLLNLTSFSIWNISTLDTSSTAISNQRIFLSDEVPLFVLFISSTSVSPDGSVILALSFTPLTRRISR